MHFISTKYHSILVIILSCFLFTACKKDDFKPEESYITVYNELDGNKKFVPLAIQQTGDQGYLVLSAFNGWNIFLMKTSPTGELIWKTEVPSPMVNAVASLLSLNGQYYFVCMDEVGLFTYLMTVDESTGAIAEVSRFTDLTYPLAAHTNGTTVYLQTYERLGRLTVLSQLDAGLTGISGFAVADTYADVSEQIVNHMTFDGKRFPFFIETAPDNSWIALSGFYNYSYSLLFFDGNLNPTGVYNGAAFTGGVNAIYPRGGNDMALARFSNDNQYFNANVTLNPSTIDIAESISASGLSEIDNHKPVIVKQIKINGTNYLALAGTTKSNQIKIMVFDGASFQLIGSKYFGQNTPYTLSDLVVTDEGGIMMLGQVKIFGNYSRIATIKLSDEQLKEVIGVE